MARQATVLERADELRLALSDEAAFESWYRRTLPRVYAYLMSRTGGDVAVSEELTQETFIAAVNQRARFDGRADTVTWLCGIARHKLADHFRVAEREERRRMRLEVRQIDLGSGNAQAIQVEDRVMIAEVFRALSADAACSPGAGSPRWTSGRGCRSPSGQEPRGDRVAAVSRPECLQALLRAGEPR